MSVGSFTWVKETILAEGNPSINDKSNIEYWLYGVTTDDIYVIIIYFQSPSRL